MKSVVVRVRGQQSDQMVMALVIEPFQTEYFIVVGPLGYFELLDSEEEILARYLSISQR